jgi:pyocin large subunit-like protein
MTTKPSPSAAEAAVTDLGAGIVRALARAAGEIDGAAALGAHFVTARAVLRHLVDVGATVAGDDAVALQDAWVDATERLVKESDAMSPADRRAVDAMRGCGTEAWAVLDDLTGRAASGAEEGGQK